MPIKSVFRVIDQMLADGVVDNYAVCGAIAASFYIEAVSTEDIDIFVHISPPPPAFAELTAIYSYLNEKGYSPSQEFVVIGDWDVQFLVPAEDSLEAEAVRNANVLRVDEIEVRVMMPEYVVAVALATGRAKDIARVKAFIEQKAVNIADLEGLIDRFSLEEQWRKISDHL